jgi:hypothetical protein
MAYFANTVLAGAKRWLESAIQVNRLKEKIHFPAETCAGVKLPELLKF